MDVDIALVRWPADEAKRRELAELGKPRLLLVAEDADPPLCVDHLEDWTRLPASDADTRARVRALIERSQSLIPTIDDMGTVTFGSAKIDLPPLHERLARPLVERFGAVVSRDTLLKRGWPDESASSNTLDVQIARLRRRLEPFGLEIRTVRSRGYLLTGFAS